LTGKGHRGTNKGGEVLAGTVFCRRISLDGTGLKEKNKTESGKGERQKGGKRGEGHGEDRPKPQGKKRKESPDEGPKKKD